MQAVPRLRQAGTGGLIGAALRPLGGTGLSVTPVGLGLAALGRPAYITLGRDRDLGDDRSVATMEWRCHEMLDAAYAAGIRYVDAARSYGRAEQFLASWLQTREQSRGRITIGSKWGYTYTGNWQIDAGAHEVKDLSLDALRRQYPESRALLGNHLNLYQAHSATLESGVLDDRRVLAELARIASEGVAIGLTVTGPRQGEVIRRALAVEVDGVNPFTVVQATWNLLEISAGPALAAAKARGWGVIIKEALANGRLTDVHAGDDLRPLAQRARALGTTLDALAIAAVLAQPWVDVALSGAVKPSHLRSHISALEIPRDAVDWPRMAESPDAYWARRSTLNWA
jgi:aryl-alcohol dehydrogenase-like predicted oxidoreductase